MGCRIMGVEIDKARIYHKRALWKSFIALSEPAGEIIILTRWRI